MNIVDQYGNSVSTLENPRKFNRATDQWSRARPWIPTQLGDIEDLILPSDRETMVFVSRLMMENWGPMTAIGRQISMYSVGTAWKPSNQSKDTDYQREAETFMREQFWPIAVMNGSTAEMTPNIKMLVQLLVRDGEYFVLLAKRKTGFPAIQIIPSHRIGSRSMGKTVETGRYKGLPICDGVVKNRQGTVVAYHFLGEDADGDKFISARSMIHRTVSDYSESVRGYPLVGHGLNDARDSFQSHEWERFNMLYRSSRTIIEHNETGVPEHPGSHFDESEGGSCSTPNSRIEQLNGGTTQIFRAGTGSKLEALQHTTPGDVYESYGNRMIRNICTGVPWPTSFVWTGNRPGGGTSERREIEQARRTIEYMQALIMPDIQRICGYATSVAAKLGILPENPDWWKWSFSMPAKLSIDDGRNMRALLDLHARGLTSDDNVLEALGQDPDDYWVRKFESGSRKEMAFQAAQEKFDVELDPRIKGVISTNEQLPEAEPVTMNSGNVDGDA